MGTGMDALLEVGRVRPALIVLDFHLPDLNALQIVQRLLEPGRRLATEVIVVSSGVPGDAQDELRRLGVRTIVGKLDGMPVVVEAVRQALGRRKVA